MGKILLYTCITGGYDTLRDPICSPGVDMICFTDGYFKGATPWKHASIPEELKSLSLVKQQRVLKICPHRYLPEEYDISIWIDGNISPKSSIVPLVAECDFDKYPLYTRQHPTRDCVYDEANAIVMAHKDMPNLINSVVKKYKDEDYPHHAGLAETNIIIRRHKDRRCILMCDTWATEMLLHSHRDQMSFNYAAWKTRFEPGYFKDMPKVNDSKYFTLTCHG